MEIPTTEIIEGLLLSPSAIAPDAIEVIEAQAREIRELQATIVRLKAEHLERQVDYEARRVGH